MPQLAHTLTSFARIIESLFVSYTVVILFVSVPSLCDLCDRSSVDADSIRLTGGGQMHPTPPRIV